MSLISSLKFLSCSILCFSRIPILVTGEQVIPKYLPMSAGHGSVFSRKVERIRPLGSGAHDHVFWHIQMTREKGDDLIDA